MQRPHSSSAASPAHHQHPSALNNGESRTSSSTFSATSFTSSVTTASSSSTSTTPLSSSLSFQNNLQKVNKGASLLSIKRPNSFPLVAEALSPPNIVAPHGDINPASRVDHDPPTCNKLPHALSAAPPSHVQQQQQQPESLPSHDTHLHRIDSTSTNIVPSSNPSAPSHDTQDRQQQQASALHPPKHPSTPSQMCPSTSLAPTANFNYSLRQSRSDAIHNNSSNQQQQQLLHDRDDDRSSRSSSNFRLSLSLSHSRSGTTDSLDEALRGSNIKSDINSNSNSISNSDQFSSSHRSASDCSLPNEAAPISISLSRSNSTHTTSSTTSAAPSPQVAQAPAPATPFNLTAVTAAQLGDFLTVFESLNVSALPASEALVTVRRLLDVLDFLTDKMALPMCERLYTALSSTTCIRALVTLLEDTNVRAKRRVTFEVLKQFRYPYVVASILSSPKIADAILGAPELLDALLGIIERPQCHAIVAAHTVNLLVTYLEYNPGPLLDVLENKTNGNSNTNNGYSTLKHIALHLHHAPVVDLVAALLPSNSITAGSHFYGAPSGEVGLFHKKQGLTFLANNRCLHVFADTFREAAEKAADAYAVGSMVASAALQNNNQIQHISEMNPDEMDVVLPEEPVEEESVRRAVYNAELKAHNAIAAYLSVIENTVRKVRVDRTSPECIYLNVYATQSTAETVGIILDTGVKCFKRSNGQCADFLIAGITATIRILEAVEKDAEKRVASTAGQPPHIPITCLSYEIRDRLSPLIMLATQKGVGMSKTAARIRMYTLQLLGIVQRVCGAYDDSEINKTDVARATDIFELLDKLRFGEVGMKMIMLHGEHSMLHTCVLKAVETALLADSGNEMSRRHWLKRSKLTWNIMKMWRKGGDKENIAAALVHLACIVHHWIACTHAQCKPGEIGEARRILGEEGISSFNDFFETTIKARVEREKGGIEKPTRPRSNNNNHSLGLYSASSPFSNGNGGISSNKKGCAHLVRSPSAHRFGYTEPTNTKRPRNRFFAELFDRNDNNNTNGEENSNNSNNNDFGTNHADAFNRIRAAAEAKLEKDRREEGNNNNSAAFTKITKSSNNNGNSNMMAGLRRSSSRLGVVEKCEKDDLFD